MLEESLYEQISEQLLSKLRDTSWYRVNLPLSALLQGDFFDTYVKRGNVSMLSSGRSGIDTIYTVHEGILRLELPKELYERAGLVGRAIPDGGRKHIRNRFAVELNLREPSMMRGKRGFERLMRAANTVLNEPVVWLFYDHWQSQTLQSGAAPIEAHNPEQHELSPSVTRLRDISVPDMRDWSEEPLRTTEDAVELLVCEGAAGGRGVCSDGEDAAPHGVERHVARPSVRQQNGVEEQAPRRWQEWFSVALRGHV